MCSRTLNKVKLIWAPLHNGTSGNENKARKTGKLEGDGTVSVVSYKPSLYQKL